jgi:hypothetical protein
VRSLIKRWTKDRRQPAGLNSAKTTGNADRRSARQPCRPRECTELTVTGPARIRELQRRPRVMPIRSTAAATPLTRPLGREGSRPPSSHPGLSEAVAGCLLGPCRQARGRRRGGGGLDAKLPHRPLSSVRHETRSSHRQGDAPDYPRRWRSTQRHVRPQAVGLMRASRQGQPQSLMQAREHGGQRRFGHPWRQG